MSARAWLIAAALALALAGGGLFVYGKTRGLRNNNPGNLRGNLGWQGQMGVDADGYAAFDTWQNGMRALLINLRNQQILHGLDTVAQILGKFAPPSENDTAAYIGDVANRLGVTPGQRLNLRDPVLLSKFGQAITHHENGLQPYNVAEIDQIAGNVA